ncbi:hypothetical protein BT63DRAFT_100092 [Microthyrium microscopicum]|uniref:Sin3 binding protein-domain-containing protein n=1 Tax=Microthyrium microscopicum TaxID=703497 RepID=A0A6A6TYY0_9PEZI|nr:hypothetical protein BT63DRAFT_100092 [Microthyrium microscopicum]
MAPVSAKPISSLAAALAQAPSIQKARDAGHPANLQSLPSSKHRGGLPTPPNSLSPTLPPHKGRSPSTRAVGNLQTIESDIDLHDAGDDAQGLSTEALSGIEAAGAITPALLAKHHLPEILLHNGPLAIRFVLAHLTQTVPGWARIPPAKARRICVAALEGRAGGGINGDVVFEKVGWGRWDARYRDDPPRETSGQEQQDDATSASISAIAAPYGTRQRTGRKARQLQSPLLSPSEDHDHVSEHEADKMSLDGHEYDEPHRRSIPVIQPPDDSDVTDEEDWDIGAEALLAGSYQPSYASRRGSHVSSLGRPSISSIQSHNVRPQFRNTSMPGLTVEAARSMSYSGGIMPFHRVYSSSLSSSLRMQGVQGSISIHQQQECGSPQEREAAEALLRMGSI